MATLSAHPGGGKWWAYLQVAPGCRANLAPIRWRADALNTAYEAIDALVPWCPESRADIVQRTFKVSQLEPVVKHLITAAAQSIRTYVSRVTVVGFSGLDDYEIGGSLPPTIVVGPPTTLYLFDCEGDSSLVDLRPVDHPLLATQDLAAYLLFSHDSRCGLGVHGTRERLFFLVLDF